ncbi:asparagine synthase (glutamine-hydrolyzing) [Psychroflexus sp. CAK1W]|uniref:asparagine synthase (glutamine-hydrolyzing) n=1 Tax=Psychroflexus curvus TaxID=2873595 RepID=UPI001CCB745E|nr:asparagine synthase (glutamine-hydrolyzing) [Psychroflexus curvus]MBZ9628913.1 asparagine synthase (glutamine-hydrolyzing) [Psychroflexus curvus]
MCGISGYVGTASAKNFLSQMVSSQHHRGPDASGIYEDPGFAALGHNRLSIIDLSAEANQPLTDASGRYVIVYNGEVYNYKEIRDSLKGHYNFRTQSDTEVVLAAYIHFGPDCLNRFNGMFAFAIWDTHTKSLFAARDRFGVKPFYYTQTKDGFYFSSEIKALKEVADTELNPSVFANYFAFGSYGMPDETFYSGIHQLPGGHSLECNALDIKLYCWYNFEERVSQIPSNLSLAQVKQHYSELLRDSISLRFRADVPVGINISGGIDSSLLLSLVNLRDDAPQIKAYTFYTGDSRYDELPWVEAMIQHTKTPLTKLVFTAEEVPEFAKIISRFQEEPFGGIPTLAYAKIFEQAQKDGVKVLLDGQGMDEAWAGYDYYHTSSQQTIQGQSAGTSPFKPQCLQPSFLALATKPKYPEPFDNALQNKQYRDLFYTKIPRALRFNDRISMAFSTELREPFLDYRLVEFAFAQPEQYKLQNGQTKFVLREILGDLVTNKVINAPKRALQTPQREWMGGELKTTMEQAINHLKASSYSHWFDFKEIQREWDSYQNGKQESSFHLWQWMNFSFLANEKNKSNYGF